MMQETAVLCRGLSKQYKAITALHPLDLEVPTGSIFGFLGRNGAGKTTTMRLLTGLAYPTSGEAWINGVPISQNNPHARAQFGYLPQSPAFYPWMTPREFLSYIADLFGLGTETKARRIDEVLTMVGMTEAEKRPIRGFSGGMLQRLGIAQALIHQPPVLFLDEPTSALDPAGRYELLSLIEQLRGQVTIFLSSHILGDVERVCDTIGVIHQGRLLTVESRDNLLDRYATNVLAVELDRSQMGMMEPLANRLQAESWVAHLQVDDNQLRLDVTDTAVARLSLLPLLAEQQVLLNKFEWKRPSLEEIFLRLSDN